MSETTNIKAKIPPQALQLESAVLGAALQFKDAQDTLFSKFTETSVFYKSEHQLLFEAIKSLYNSNQPIDVLTVENQLKQMNKLKDAGGTFYLIELMQRVNDSAHTDFHTTILLQKYMARKIISLCNDGIVKAYDDNQDIFQLFDTITASMDSISSLMSKGHTSMTWSDAVRSIPKRVEFLTNNDGKITGVTTGLTNLDKHFSGWQPGDLVIIGADSGMGKTAFVLNNMIAAAKDKVPVGMFSMEMSVIQLAIRGIATKSNFHLNQLMRKGFEKQEYFQTLQSVVDSVAKYPIYIDDQPALTVQEMKRKARSMKRQHKIEMLVIDFVQMFSGDKDIRINISEAARECKNIAKELEIPVLALSQLSREVKKAKYMLPSKHHLKESSAIEEAADVIMMLYRPEYYGFKPESDSYLYNDILRLEPDENATAIVVKNRNGALGNVGMHYVENKTKYVNPEEAYRYRKDDDNDDDLPY